MLLDRQMAEKMAELPDECAARLPSDNSAILIRKGEDGYWPAGRDLDVDAYNAALGVTWQQREAMMAGSMFGWNCPGADPLNYGIAPRRR